MPVTTRQGNGNPDKHRASKDSPSAPPRTPKRSRNKSNAADPPTASSSRSYRDAQTQTENEPFYEAKAGPSSRRHGAPPPPDAPGSRPSGPPPPRAAPTTPAADGEPPRQPAPVPTATDWVLWHIASAWFNTLYFAIGEWTVLTFLWSRIVTPAFDTVLQQPGPGDATKVMRCLIWLVRLVGRMYVSDYVRNGINDCLENIVRMCITFLRPRWQYRRA